MNFLSALLKGLLLPTDKFEELLNNHCTEAVRYREIETSDKLKEYLELDKIVGSDAFQSKKKELTTTKYSATEEGKTMARKKALALNPNVQRYNALINMSGVKEYLAFISDAANYEKLNNKELLDGDSFLRKMKKMDKSLFMRDLRNIQRKSSVKEYLAVKEKIATPEFQEKNTFWANSRRWFETPESKQEERYESLKKDTDIQFFLNADVEEIKRTESYKEIYHDDFNWNKMDNSDWKSGFMYPSKEFISNHSYVEELQAYNHGKNVVTHDSILEINTYKEKTTAPAWDSKKGMIMKEFSYTSDVINNGDKLSIKEGDIIQVKARCRGFLDHGIYLRSAKHSPFISVFDYTGLKIYCGLHANKGDDRKAIKGMQPIAYMIYTVAWEKDALVWYVNNMEIYRTKHTISSDEQLYLHMYSSLKKNERRNTEGKLQVDWVKVYRPKNNL